MIRAAVIGLLALSLSGCASGWSCDGWARIQVSRADDRDTKKAVLAHNEFGRKQGCWR